MRMQPVIIVHHHEIILKGNNRRFFEQKLLNNIRLALFEHSGIVFSGGYGRFILELPVNSDTEGIVAVLKTVFGLANICVGLKVAQDISSFTVAAEKLLEGNRFATMKVDTRRSDKQFPHRSQEVSAAVGEFLVNRFHVRGKMKNPDETIFIEIANKHAYVYRSKIQGAGGLPSGVSGKVVSLISAGFDSPVASWRMMRRGASVIFVHFHSMPYTTQYSVDQVRNLVQILTRYQFRSRLYIVPFADIQNKIVVQTPPPLRIVLYRRMMIRIAEALARRENAEALVTGEAVGQVASQTLRNIRVIDEAAGMPILRPLAGADKEETMDLARVIGTHKISEEPYDDCCSFLAPRSPETWAKRDDVFAAEVNLDIPALTELALKNLSLEIVLHTALRDVPSGDIVSDPPR